MEVSTDDGEQGARGTLTAGDDESTVQCAGWTVVTRRGRPKERTPVSAADKQQVKPNAGKQAKGSNLTRAQFAQKVNRTFARTARMPRMPAETEKIIIRPRGGLAIREVEPLEFNRALATAAKIDLSAFRQDITYPNPGQNILVVSTPCLVRAQAYSNMAAGKGRRITPENGADKMANGGNGKAPPASSNTDNEEIAELRGMVKQLIETVKKQGEMLERYRLASTQQTTTAPKEGTGWQLGNVPRPASLTPPWVGTTEPLQPLSKKMRKRAVETPAAVEDDSGMVVMPLV
ncbi:hypothetical protein HPB48_006167 [Haemaphysalis longicornis]|uniref:Uncharacterized protein n=1 Tax=Haemaphysalis longicornis TaxID=44386 RepID=A0A9J6H017_HAELO|nr:hypothetical protein HPB48_006167 [Haemaphysalis longicornis]